jgi:hypothetical protein
MRSAGGTNLYAYADKDPVNQIDLTGENPVVFMMLATDVPHSERSLPGRFEDGR